MSDARLSVGQTFLSAGSGDFPVASSNNSRTVQESPVKHRQECNWKAALPWLEVACTKESPKDSRQSSLWHPHAFLVLNHQHAENPEQFVKTCLEHGYQDPRSNPHPCPLPLR